MAAYGAILVNGAGFSHPDDMAAAELKCCGFRPLLGLTYQANARFGGWIATNLALHLAVAFLLYRWTGSLIGTLLFAAHPMAADAVASVAGRSALVLAVPVLLVFSLASRWRWLGVVLVASAAGFLPGYWSTIQDVPRWLDHVGRFSSAVASYIGPRMFIPFDLSADPWITFSILGCAAGFAASGVMLILGMQPIPREWRIAFGLMALPLAAYMAVPLPDVFLEHRAYLSLAGASLMLGLLLRRSRPVAAAVLCLFIALSNVRAQVYATPLTLWADAVEKAPLNARARVNYGAVLAFAHRHAEAKVHFEEAIRLQPSMGMAWRNLAALHLVNGDTASASDVLDAYSDFQRKDLVQ